MILDSPNQLDINDIPVLERQVSPQTLNTLAIAPIHTQIVKTRRTTCHSVIILTTVIWFDSWKHCFIRVKSIKSLKNVTDIHYYGHAVGPIV